MKDALDIDGIYDSIRNAGLKAAGNGRASGEPWRQNSSTAS